MGQVAGPEVDTSVCGDGQAKEMLNLFSDPSYNLYG